MTSEQKILLDANVVINAALLPQSFAARAVVLAKQAGQCQFLVSTGVMREVQKLLNNYSPDEARLALAGERVNHLLQWLTASVIADDDSSAAPASIPKNDGHVFRAACRAGAAVLTVDAGLWLGCRACNVPAFLPLKLIRQRGGMALQTIVFGVAATPAAGSLFARGYPGAWAGAREGKFTLVHFPGGYWVYYDAAESCWVAEVAGLKGSSGALKVKAPVVGSALQTVCLSWQCTGNKPKIELRVAGVAHPDTVPLTASLDFRPSGNPVIGSFSANRHFWNGHIYFCISNDRPVAEKSWKKYQNDRDLAPNPYDADRVAAAIRSLPLGAVSPAATLS